MSSEPENVSATPPRRQGVNAKHVRSTGRFTVHIFCRLAGPRDYAYKPRIYVSRMPKQPAKAGEDDQTNHLRLDNPHLSQGMTMIRSVVLSSTRAASRKHPTSLPSPIPFSSVLLQSIRQMSTSETKKLHFMIYAPDHTDPEAFQRRLSFRTEHLQRVGTLREEGVLSAWCCSTFLWSRDTDRFHVTRQSSVDRPSPPTPFSPVPRRR